MLEAYQDALYCAWRKPGKYSNRTRSLPLKENVATSVTTLVAVEAVQSLPKCCVQMASNICGDVVLQEHASQCQSTLCADPFGYLRLTRLGVSDHLQRVVAVCQHRGGSAALSPADAKASCSCETIFHAPSSHIVRLLAVCKRAL